MTDLLTKKKKENEPSSFAAWIRKHGTANTNTVTPDAAATARAKSAPTYGKNAEWLSERGLQSSGYARFLANEADRSFSAAKQKYASDNAAVKEKNLAGYAKYLTSHEDRQDRLRMQMIDSIESDGSFDLESAFNKAIAGGLTEENARVAAELGVVAAKQRAASRLLEMILEQRLSRVRVEGYARSLGFSEEEVERFGKYAQVIGGTTVPQIFDKTN